MAQEEDGVPNIVMVVPCQNTGVPRSVACHPGIVLLAVKVGYAVKELFGKPSS